MSNEGYGDLNLVDPAAPDPQVEFNGVQEFPGQNTRHAGFSATGSLRRSEFGIEFGLLPIGMALGQCEHPRATS